MGGARLGKTLPSPCGSLDKLNISFRAAARLADAIRCMHRAASLPAGVIRRRSYQHIARSQLVGSPADYPCTVSASICVDTVCTDSPRFPLQLARLVFCTINLWRFWVIIFNNKNARFKYLKNKLESRCINALNAIISTSRNWQFNKFDKTNAARYFLEHRWFLNIQRFTQGE